MIDTHCHLDHEAFATDREAVLQRSQSVGVNEWVIPAITLPRFAAMQALASPHVHLAFGLHPLYYADHPDDALNQLAHWLNHSRPLAIGEIGLDGMAPRASQQQQMYWFSGQLAMAHALALPVLLHVRKCHEEVLACLQNSRFSGGGIVHAFSGSLQQAQRYRQLGFCLGIGGVVTRPQARRLHAVVQSVADDALVLESDAPDLPPSACVGQRNEPAFISWVVQALAELRQTTESHIATMTTNNARKVLRLPK
ncbi:MAG: TatD family hydrolase [Magnetococcales bacterium]|nr:TatD family hydrolase [Magnetococcales bacterium]